MSLWAEFFGLVAKLGNFACDLQVYVQGSFNFHAGAHCRRRYIRIDESMNVMSHGHARSHLP